jgi:hypothetical protein
MIHNDKMKCPICTAGASSVGGDAMTLSIDCPICGHFKVLSRVIKDIKAFPRHILSGVARNYWEINQAEFNFSDKNCESNTVFYKSVPFPVPGETAIPSKANLILRYLERKSTYPGEYVELYHAHLYSIAYCKTPQEFGYCCGYLKELRYIEYDPSKGSPSSWRITPSGWSYLSGIGAEGKDQGFIAMAFRLPISDVLHIDGLNPGITNAGYNPLRIDRKDHNNRIDDEIVAEIRKSKFVVADLTGKNAGAYFEAGFAMGLNKPVIWTCQQAEIDAGNVHFDTRQYSIVSWEQDKLEDFSKRLTKRIEATIGHGRHVPELATRE